MGLYLNISLVLRVYMMYWISLFSLFAVASAITACEDGQINVNGTGCCSICPAGHGVIAPCAPGNDTLCEQCVVGETYSLTESHEDECVTCAECPKHMHIKRPCNVTHNTECQCDRHFYESQELYRCLLCDLCQIQYGVASFCTPISNTVCEKCPNGTYSSMYSVSDRCTTCSECHPGQKKLQECTRSQDTVCIDIEKMNKDSVWRNRDDSRPLIPEKKESEIDVIPLYCAALAAVVVGLFGYVIFKHIRRLREKKRTKEPHEDIEYSKASGGGDSGIYIEVEQHQKLLPSTYSSCSKIRDLPPLKRREVEKTLAADAETHDWKLVAREIGYNNRQIASFELKATHDSSCPVKHLFLEWGKSENATTAVLIKTLKKIGRPDVAEILASGMTDNKNVIPPARLETGS